MAWTHHWAAGKHDAQPAYYQFVYEGNPVGCGPVVLAMLFCWADHQASNGNAYWAPRTGIYRKDGGRGAEAVAPLEMDSGVRNVVKEIRGQVNTFVIAGQGATGPWDMQNAEQYLNGRTNTSLRTAYNIAGFAQDDIRDRAIKSIRDRNTPAVIGIGWLSHYPMAYGYAWRKRATWWGTATDRYFYVNQGWGNGGDSEAVCAETWFAGEIYP